MSQQLGMPTGLGIVPQWLFSPDPAVNIRINPFVKMPAEWTHGQRTVQPIGLVPAKTTGVEGLGFFDTWWWTNRKTIALGTIGVLGIGLLVLVGKLLK
jgi:hypothetical protein